MKGKDWSRDEHSESPVFGSEPTLLSIGKAPLAEFCPPSPKLWAFPKGSIWGLLITFPSILFSAPSWVEPLRMVSEVAETSDSDPYEMIKHM